MEYLPLAGQLPLIEKKYVSYICAYVCECIQECSAYGGPRRELAPLELELHDIVSC